MGGPPDLKLPPGTAESIAKEWKRRHASPIDKVLEAVWEVAGPTRLSKAIWHRLWEDDPKLAPSIVKGARDALRETGIGAMAKKVAQDALLDAEIDREHKEFNDLRDRLERTTDAAERERLKDEIAMRIFLGRT